jgi:uncharacterized membrane-anchored protein YhcB (DUF1043 family)
MAASGWLQFALTIGTLMGAMIVAYFKNETLLRREIQASEERLRNRIDAVRDEVHSVDKRLAVFEGLLMRAEWLQKQRA